LHVGVLGSLYYALQFWTTLWLTYIISFPVPLFLYLVIAVLIRIWRIVFVWLVFDFVLAFAWDFGLRPSSITLFWGSYCCGILARISDQ